MKVSAFLHCREAFRGSRQTLQWARISPWAVESVVLKAVPPTLSLTISLCVSIFLILVIKVKFCCNLMVPRITLGLHIWSLWCYCLSSHGYRRNDQSVSQVREWLIDMLALKDILFFLTQKFQNVEKVRQAQASIKPWLGYHLLSPWTLQVGVSPEYARIFKI